MQNREELLSIIIDKVEDYAIFLLDPGGNVVSWNRGAERLIGYTWEEICGQHLSVFYPPNERELADEKLAIAAQTGNLQVEGWRLRKDGSRFWASISVTSIRDEHGKPAGFLKITRDLTERQRATEELNQSKEKYDLLMAGVQEFAIFLMDLDGRITDWNAAAERLLGYSQDEIIGQHFNVIWTPEEGEPGAEVDTELRQAASTGRSSDDRWHVRKDGTHFWANGITSALRDEEGNLRGFAKVLHDKTDRKRLEEELRAKANELEEADRRKNEFLAMLAHELRNPLAPVASALSILKLDGFASPESQETVNVMERQIQKMTRLINDLMDVTRITRGKVQLHRERIDLRDCISNALAAAKVFIDERSHSLAVTLPDEPLWLSADSTRLEQVFENLLNNAAKYTEPGGQISLAVERHNGHVFVRVSDTGVGIMPELLPHVFEMFTQSDRSLDRAEGGLGIGLTIVKSIVEMHDGVVSAATRGPGKGSEFTVQLPLLLETHASPAVSPLNPPQSTVPKESALRVLVVDDNADAAKMLAMLLRARHHEVQTAECGLVAMELTASFQPHVILLDIGLPTFDGYKVAQRLRQQPATKNVVLVALTGYGQPEDRQRSKEAGFDFHLVKPVELTDLDLIFEGLSAS